MATINLCVGVDIGSSSLKVCHLQASRGEYRLKAYAESPIPQDSIVDGVVINHNAVRDCLSGLLKDNGIKAKAAAISVAGNAVIIKKISMNQMSGDELDRSIQWEAEQFIPFDINDVFLDAHRLGDNLDVPGQMDVVLVAAKREVVNEHVSVVSDTGLKPMVCDVDAFAMETSYEQNYGLNTDDNIVLVDIGATTTTINILSKGVSSFTRDLTVGGNNFTGEIQRHLNVEREEAEGLKLAISANAQQVTADIRDQVRQAISIVCENIANELHRSIDFYTATTGSSSPANIFLAGGVARLDQLRQMLYSRIHIPCEIFDPFKNINTSDFDEEYLRAIAPPAAVVVGLALRHQGDHL
jgi:type IV pilus assembly protein PilM